MVTYESHNCAILRISVGLDGIIKGVKMLFFKCYPNALAYKFDMFNG